MAVLIVLMPASQGQEDVEWWATGVGSLKATREEVRLEAALTMLAQGKLVEAANTLANAIQRDPSLSEAWTAFAEVERRMPRPLLNLPQAQAHAAFDAVLTCGSPDGWPRFAVAGCATTYVRFADELDQDGLDLNAARYRHLAAVALIDYGRRAAGSGAVGCAEVFLSLSESIEPFSSHDIRTQQGAYELAALLSKYRQNYLKAIEAYERLAHLGEISNVTWRQIDDLMDDVWMSISWDPRTGALRNPDTADFFGGLLDNVGGGDGNIPYGMSSVEEDDATTFAVMLGTPTIEPARLVEPIITARLAAKNFELPVKVALYYAGDLYMALPWYRKVLLQRLIKLNARIYQAMEGVDDIPEQTLIGFEVANGIARITSVTPPPD